MPQLHELTAAQLAHQIRAREVSAVDVAEALLARTDALESLQAWVYIDRETVLADAEQRQRELDSLPNPGPLHGVPVGVKDIFYTAGIPTTACSQVYADFVPDRDAAVLTSLKQAGAIMMGKTVTTEFACLDPSQTLNPWNPAHTPRRLQQRLGGVGSYRNVSCGAGVADRRVSTAPRILQRRGGPQAYLRPCQPSQRRAGELVAGHHGLDGPLRRGRGPDASDNGRPRRQ